ncbi:hypothetical protein LTR78_003217 [Recurvomyces mirabilis]|uniref:Uncharacterized protein n=1 Tax=Recurvomyces mirabilis TaxID=574656 RepID=A0AAE1C3Q1_9PEZI|nr:hypothetical protein LTR78_003217 [Recurvomyces mirabilis]KAK5156963.1 hypothetical protein LTS14_004480 [Recurvomyces mirabilis]
MVDIANAAADAEFERAVFEDRMASPLANGSSSIIRSPRSPDTASPIYPERAIRPLPRSRLKSRLSPEQATHIQYPSEPPVAVAASPVPSSPHAEYEGARGMAQRSGNGSRSVQGYANHVHSHEDPHYHRHDIDAGHCTCGQDGEDGVDSGDEEVEFDHPDYRYAPASVVAGGTPTPIGQHINGTAMMGKPPLDSVQRRLMEAARLGAAGKLPPPITGSTASSGDGYESFENTSNKKKRKIPLSTASSALHHQSSLSAEMASMGISGQGDGAGDESAVLRSVASEAQAYAAAVGGASAAGTGISGAGRGRYGRTASVPKNGLRRPLGSGPVNVPNGYGPHKSTGRSGEGLPNGDEHYENTGGIISQAIKTAAQQGPLTPQKAANGGKENASLLQTASSPNNTVTPKTQFTFHCDSESATKMVDQEAAAATAYAQAAYNATAQQMPGSYPSSAPPQNRMPNGQHVNANMQRAQGTQTTPSLRGQQQAGSHNAARPPPPPVTGNGGAPLPPHPNNPHPQQQNVPAPPPAPKPRRKPSKEYALAARQRQLQQEYTNYHHRPTKDTMWICAFCEYEDIFGVPPVALIRSYEIRDRKERKKAEEKRRLLEKARMKGKKGRGRGKKGANNMQGQGANTVAPAGNATNVSNGQRGAVGDVAYDPDGLPLPEGDEELYDEEEEDEEDYEGEDDLDGGRGPDGEFREPYYRAPPAPAGTPTHAHPHAHPPPPQRAAGGRGAGQITA